MPTKRLPIPKTFKLFGHTIRVARNKKMDTELDARGWIGMSEFTKNRIGLHRSETEFHPEVLEQTFWHEAVHMLLDKLNYTELSRDEDFVNRVSEAIYQILTTSKY